MEALSPQGSRGSNRSRRSFPNLTHLSLAPLSSRFPIDEDDYEEPETEYEPRSSYIQGKSAPSTPGILTSSNRKPRTASVKPKSISYAHESYFPPQAGSYNAPITKAKSVGAISAPQLHFSLVDSAKTARARGSIVQHDDEWLHRAGLTLTNEARESKGQSWLASRASSTSLVHHDDDHDGYGDDGSPKSSRTASRRASRTGSRITSARPSRRSSKVGSRPSFITPAEPRTPGFRTVEEYFEEEVIEADFVELEDEDGTAAEAEVQRLSSVQSFAVGSFIDRLVGLPLFKYDDESEDDDQAITEDETAEEALKRKQLRLKKRKEELAKAASSSASAINRKEVTEPPKQSGEGGWKDVAWLLSVASKVIL